MFSIIRLRLFLFLAFLSLSCSTQKRAERHIARAVVLSSPEHIISHVVDRYCRNCLDTYKVILEDTVFLKEVEKDTIVKTQDTIVYKDSLIYIRIIRGADSTRLKYIIKRDTIVRKIEVPTYKVNVIKSENSSVFTYIYYILLFLLILVLIYKLYKDYEHRGNK